MRRFTPPPKSGGFGERERDQPPPLPGFLSNYLNTRRPSWTPSLPENPDGVRDRDTLFMSSSYSQQRRPRKRRVEDISSFSPLERIPNPNSPLAFNFNFPNQNTGLLRRSSVVCGPSLPESIERPRKRIISADVFAEKENQQLKDLPETPSSAEPVSPEDGSNLRRSLQIDMKGLVGDAVGNMSISPSSRDVVLAARRGLFILDLESPLEVPRFLPQGGTWDVADVQWNPHPQRDQFIVSTSSEKLLIWNLLLVGKTSIEHILKSHYRAITDINWHTTECDTVASIGIDSWIYAWDLRDTKRPMFGFSAFKAGGTQVKWNRRDGNILASAHANEVLIWDRRKGSIPVSHIVAHDAKIYGIDWSHTNRNELVTCSLGKTIKTWDISSLYTSSIDSNTNTSPTFLNQKPKSIIKTTYPVWRALNLPFGHGILSLPQRGETVLEMYAAKNVDEYDDGDEEEVEVGRQAPVEVFEGHTDVVKEFVWRKGGPDEFQLITWSKDRTLRFWPVENATLEKVGHTPTIEPNRGRSRLSKTRLRLMQEQTISYRNPPETHISTPTLSIPIGNRPILDEIRAPLPPGRVMQGGEHHRTITGSVGVGGGLGNVMQPNPVIQPHIGSAARAKNPLESYVPGVGVVGSPPSTPTTTGTGTSTGTGLSLPHQAGNITKAKPVAVGPNRRNRDLGFGGGGGGRGGGGGETMTKGNAGKSVARMDAFTWLSNVKVGGASGGAGSSGAGGVGSGIGGNAGMGGARREGSSGAASAVGGNTSGSSRIGSTSRVASGADLTANQNQDQRVREAEVELPAARGGGGGVLSRNASLARRSRGEVLPPCQQNQSQSQGGRSGSRASGDIIMEKEGAENQPLQDEITSVLTKLASSRIKLEKYDLSKKRTCTLGLHGPWGERSSVFIRITFTFPREYPSHPHPDGTPIIDLERSPLVSMKDRAFMLKRLKTIRERKRPCLEPCLRFLLFGAEEEEDGRGGRRYVDGESSDEDVFDGGSGVGAETRQGEGIKGKGKEVTVSLLRNHKNLVEPRTTQGAFGPNGELMCFFRAPPRLVRPVMSVRNFAATAESTPEKLQPPRLRPAGEEDQCHEMSTEVSSKPRGFSSPALLLDAVRKLTMAAVDRPYVPDPRRQRGEETMGRIMTDLLTLSRHQARGGGDNTQQQQQQQQRNQLAVIPVRRSMMYASNINWLDGPDKKVAAEYMFEADSLAGVCEKNAKVARGCRRRDHERAWKTLEGLFKNVNSNGNWVSVECERLAKGVFMKIYDDFAKNKDLQMLAMLAVLILQTSYATITALPQPKPTPQRPSINVLPSSIRSPRTSALDYFTITQGLNAPPTSPALGRLPPSPIAPALAPSLSSSTSSRGSWTSIFNTGRQFVQDTFTPTLATPADLPVQSSDRQSISTGSDKLRASDSPIAPTVVGHRRRKDSQLALTQAQGLNASVMSRSWTETVPLHPKGTPPSAGSTLGSSPFSSLGVQTGSGSGGSGTKRPANLRWTGSGQSGLSAMSGPSEKQFVVFDSPEDKQKPKPVFTEDFIKQLVVHVHIYAELLFRWQMYEKRIQLLKTVNKRNHVKQENKGVHHQVGIVQTCTHCGTPLRDKSLECHACLLPRTMALCSICRLPVKGLSRNCLHCLHIAHISCWNALEVPICPTGCGCLCIGFPNSSQESNLTRPSTRLAFSPPAPTALILS